MNLYDEDETKKEKKRPSKTKALIIILIILLVFLIAIITTLIIYIMYNPVKISVYIDGVQKNNFADLLDIQTDENGKTEIYFPIKDVAPYFGYIGYKGEYGRASEDNSQCYVINEDYEVAMYTLQSNTIYKLNLQERSSDYDYCKIDRDVFESNGNLYTSIDGLEQGFNLTFSYNEAKKTIRINTLPYLASVYNEDLKTRTLGSYGKVELDDKLSNWKAIFDGMLIVKTENSEYGVISTDKYSIILEPKYDGISYVQYSTDFMIVTNRKVGLLSKDGKTKINALYDELTLMDRNNKLYRVKKGSNYGVINENEDTILYPEYEKIGIDINDFSVNGVKNGYILLDKLIPVMQDRKWGFFDLTGKTIADFEYDEIGCKAKNANNVYSLLEIPNYNILIVGKDRKYSFMDTNGDDEVLSYGFIFDEIFMKISSGETSYVMKYNNKDFDVIEYLKRQGRTEVTESQK